MKKILLMGNPNVGKSVIFSRLTSVNVISSNYPGTTVEFKEGSMLFENEKCKLIDVPGTYTIEPTCKAEKIATETVKEGNLIINVLDATHLERNLLLTLQLLESKKPMIVVLNLWDETEHKGIKINVKKLEKELKVPIVKTSALTGEGIKELVTKMSKTEIPKTKKSSTKEKWERIGEIIAKVQKVTHKHHTLGEKFRDLTIKPFFGIPFAIFTLAITFKAIRIIGEGLIQYILEPLFNTLWTPIVLKIGTLLEAQSFIYKILIGHTAGTEINYTESLGLLTTGLFVPIGMVMPYIIAFYLALSILEDTGYLPRLAVLVDNVLHKFGLHGCAIIPMLLGLGCNVPGALASRILETKRERFIAITLIAISVPCMAQIAMIIGLIGHGGFKGIAIVFGTLALVGLILGIIMNKILKGESPEIFLEIPPYRRPHLKSLLKKTWIRLRSFLKEAIPYILIGVLFINIIYTLNILHYIADITAPIITGVFGLPKEAVMALIVGFLRKDVAIGMLLPLNLTPNQLIVASVVLAMYFPCIATFVVMIKELGIKDMLKSSAIMLTATLIVGGTLNFLLNLF